MYKHFLVIILTAAGIAMALSLMGTLAPAFATSVRLELAEEPVAAPSGGFLTQLRSWLSIRGPTHPTIEPGTIFTVHASAYAPSKQQTDSTPCTTAAGTTVRRGTVASNFLPLGTILEIDGQLYIVEDRMNPRFQRSIDIFFLSTSEALEFGRQQIEVEVIGYGEPGQPLTGLLVDEVGNITQIADAEGQIDQPPEELGFVARVRGRYYYLRRLAAELIGARSVSDVNRYDIDCLAQENTAAVE